MADDLSAANLRIRIFGAVAGSPKDAQAVWEVVGPELDRLNGDCWTMHSQKLDLRRQLKQAEAERDAANASWYRMLRRADEAEAYLLNSERRRVEQGVATGEAIQRAERAEAERDALKAATDRVRALVETITKIPTDSEHGQAGARLYDAARQQADIEHGHAADCEVHQNGYNFCSCTAWGAACAGLDVAMDAVASALDHPTDTTGGDRG